MSKMVLYFQDSWDARRGNIYIWALFDKLASMYCTGESKVGDNRVALILKHPTKAFRIQRSFERGQSSLSSESLLFDFDERVSDFGSRPGEGLVSLSCFALNDISSVARPA